MLLHQLLKFLLEFLLLLPQDSDLAVFLKQMLTALLEEFLLLLLEHTLMLTGHTVSADLRILHLYF
jgi:hypothetical protein